MFMVHSASSRMGAEGNALVSLKGRVLNRYRSNCQRRRPQRQGVRQRLHHRRDLAIGTCELRERPRSSCPEAAIDIHANAYASRLTRAQANATLRPRHRPICRSATDATGNQVANVSLVNAGTLSIVAAATAIPPDVTIVSNGDYSSTRVTTNHATATASVANGKWHYANAVERTEGVVVTWELRSIRHVYPDLQLQRRVNLTNSGLLAYPCGGTRLRCR